MTLSDIDINLQKVWPTCLNVKNRFLFLLKELAIILIHSLTVFRSARKTAFYSEPEDNKSLSLQTKNATHDSIDIRQTDPDAM